MCNYPINLTCQFQGVLEFLSAAQIRTDRRKDCAVLVSRSVYRTLGMIHPGPGGEGEGVDQRSSDKMTSLGTQGEKGSVCSKQTCSKPSSFSIVTTASGRPGALGKQDQ